MTTRASWSILSIDEDAQTISLDATIRFQWNSTSLERHQGIRIHLFCDQVKHRQPQEQCANCNRLNSSWRFPQQNPIMREGERIWVKPWHCEEATGWGRWLLQVHFWFEELAVITNNWMICHLLLLYLSLSMIWYFLWNELAKPGDAIASHLKLLITDWPTRIDRGNC